MTKKVNCILLVDDDPITNFFHETVIEECEAANIVRVAENGQEALDYLLNQGKFDNAENNPRPQMILLDINMPIMNGFEFLEEYENIAPEYKADGCLLMLTTSLNDKDLERAQKFKTCDSFLNKPLEADTLTSAIAKYCR